MEWEALVRDEEEELPVVVISPEFLLSAIVALLQRPEWRTVDADAVAAVFLPTIMAECIHLPAAALDQLWWAVALRTDGLPRFDQERASS